MQRVQGARGRASQGALSGYRMSMQYGRSGSWSCAIGVPVLPSQYLIVLSHDDVTMQFISCAHRRSSKA